MVTLNQQNRSLWKFAVVGGLALGSAASVLLIFEIIGSPSALNFFALEVALLSLVGIGVYVLLGDRVGETPDTRSQQRDSGYLRALISASIFAIGLGLWSLWGSLYVPSPLYYVSVSVGVASIAAQIAYGAGTGRHRSSTTLAQIVAVGALFQISFPLLNPNSVLSDPYFHWLGIEGIIGSGAVAESLGFYFYFPAFHVLNVAILEIGSFGFEGYALLNHGLMLIVVVAIYLLGREVVSTSKALLASLLLTVSTFFFLAATFLPIFMGASIMLLALFALARYRKSPNRKWWVVFWVLALVVFFSHPVNALVLAGILGVFLLVHRLHARASTQREFAAPTVTYSVAYLGYIMFLAINAFTLLTLSLTESGPRYYFARTVEATAIPASFVIQTVASTLGFSILFAFASIALVSWFVSGGWNQRFIFGIMVVFTAIPALVILLGRGPFGLQAARALLYLNIFVVIPAAAGVLFLFRFVRQRSVRVAAVAFLIFISSFLSSTSYLTGSGTRFLTDSIPIQTTYVTDSMLASGEFLRGLPPFTPLALDPALTVSMGEEGGGFGYFVRPYSLAHNSWVQFASGYGNRSVALALSSLYLANSGYQALDPSQLDSVYAIRAYDNGGVRIYAPTGD